MYLAHTLYNLWFEVGLFLVSLIMFFLWFSVLLVALVGFIEVSSREGRRGVKVFILPSLAFIL